MNKVYITNDSGHDYSDAVRFGKLVYCTQGTLDKQDTAGMYRELSIAMDDSGPDDYIVLSGLTSLCSIACSMYSMRHGHINLLVFVRRAYTVRHINFDNWMKGFNRVQHQEA